MALEKKIRSVKRFGARYGRNIKRKFGLIEHDQRRKHKCPFCSAERVRRKFVGVWGCTKCGKIFTSKAYTVAKLKREEKKKDFSVESLKNRKVSDEAEH